MFRRLPPACARWRYAGQCTSCILCACVGRSVRVKEEVGRCRRGRTWWRSVSDTTLHYFSCLDRGVHFLGDSEFSFDALVKVLILLSTSPETYPSLSATIMRIYIPGGAAEACLRMRPLKMATFAFPGKRALVTGAGKGIGRATVKALVQCGADVIALSRTEQDLLTLKEEIPGVSTVCVDISDLGKVEAAVKVVGPIHLLVNNAGVSQLQSVLTTTPDVYDRIMSVNLKAPLFLSQYVAQEMIKRGDGGAIVNVSSVASNCALNNHLAYCVSKAGMDMMTKVMGLELGPHQIRVNAVNPTVVLTDMGKMAWSGSEKRRLALNKIPLGRFAVEDDVVNAILFLLSEGSSMLNGVTLPVDGGQLVQ